MIIMVSLDPKERRFGASACRGGLFSSSGAGEGENQHRQSRAWIVSGMRSDEP